MVDLVISMVPGLLLGLIIGLFAALLQLLWMLFRKRGRDGLPGLLSVPLRHPAAGVKPCDGELDLALTRSEAGLFRGKGAAVRCWKLMDGRRRVLAIARRITEEFGIPRREAIDDVRRFIRRLKKRLLALEASEWSLFHTHRSALFAGRAGDGIEEWVLSDTLVVHGAACLRAPDGSLEAWRGTALRRRAGARALRAHREREAHLVEATKEYERGMAHCSAGRLEEAEEAFRRSAARAPGWADACYRIGYVALRRGHYEEARRWLERAENRSPGILMVREYLGQTRRLASGDLAHEAFLLIDRAYSGGLRDPDGTIRLARQALEISPGDPSARLILARAYKKKGLLAEALDELNLVIRADPDPATLCHALLIRGSVFMLQRSPEMAQREFEKVIEIGGSQTATRTAEALSFFLGAEPRSPRVH